MRFFLVGMLISCAPLYAMEFSGTFSFDHDIGTSLIQFPSRPAKYEKGRKVTLDWKSKESRARLTWNAIPVDPHSRKQIEHYFQELGALILGKKPGQVNTSKMKIEIENRKRDRKSPIFSLPIVLKPKNIVKDWGREKFGKRLKYACSSKKKVAEYELEYEKGISFVRIELISKNDLALLVLFHAHGVERKSFDRFVTSYQLLDKTH